MPRRRVCQTCLPLETLETLETREILQALSGHEKDNSSFLVAIATGNAFPGFIELASGLALRFERFGPLVFLEFGKVRAEFHGAWAEFHRVSAEFPRV